MGVASAEYLQDVGRTRAPVMRTLAEESAPVDCPWHPIANLRGRICFPSELCLRQTVGAKVRLVSVRSHPVRHWHRRRRAPSSAGAAVAPG